MAVNVVLSAGKMVAGFFGHSHALIADGVESLADIFSSVIVWRGMVIASEPADADHPYGHGKAEPLAAALVALMLLLAAFWIASHAVATAFNPHQPPAVWTLPVLLFVVVVKETLFRFVLREGDSVESSAVQSDAWHHRSDAITSCFAAAGIGIALAGGPQFAAADDVAALLASFVIAWNGWRLLRPAFGELMDTAPDQSERDAIRALAAGVSEVRLVEKCLVRKMGWHLYVDMHVHVDAQMTVERAHRIAHEVKDRIRQQYPKVRDVLVHVEPERRSPA